MPHVLWKWFLVFTLKPHGCLFALHGKTVCSNSISRPEWAPHCEYCQYCRPILSSPLSCETTTEEKQWSAVCILLSLTKWVKFIPDSRNSHTASNSAKSVSAWVTIPLITWTVYMHTFLLVLITYFWVNKIYIWKNQKIKFKRKELYNGHFN